MCPFHFESKIDIGSHPFESAKVFENLKIKQIRKLTFFLFIKLDVFLTEAKKVGFEVFLLCESSTGYFQCNFYLLELIKRVQTIEYIYKTFIDTWFSSAQLATCFKDLGIKSQEL